MKLAFVYRKRFYVKNGNGESKTMDGHSNHNEDKAINGSQGIEILLLRLNCYYVPL